MLAALDTQVHALAAERDALRANYAKLEAANAEVHAKNEALREALNYTAKATT